LKKKEEGWEKKVEKVLLFVHHKTQKGKGKIRIEKVRGGGYQKGENTFRGLLNGK